MPGLKTTRLTGLSWHPLGTHRIQEAPTLAPKTLPFEADSPLSFTWDVLPNQPVSCPGPHWERSPHDLVPWWQWNCMLWVRMVCQPSHCRPGKGFPRHAAMAVYRWCGIKNVTSSGWYFSTTNYKRLIVKNLHVPLFDLKANNDTKIATWKFSIPFLCSWGWLNYFCSRHSFRICGDVWLQECY